MAYGNYEVNTILRRAKQMQTYGQSLSSYHLRGAVRGALESSQERAARWESLGLQKRSQELSEKSQKESQTLAERAQGENLNISQQNVDIARRRAEQDAEAQEAQATAGYMIGTGALMTGTGQTGITWTGMGAGGWGPIAGGAAGGYVGGQLGGSAVSHNRELQKTTPWGGKETERKAGSTMGGAMG